jgi:hypothetical protein
MSRIYLGFCALVVALLCAGCPPTPGVTCRTHDDCKGLTDGYCARAEICTRECSSGKPCPTGSNCSNEGRRVCLPTCTDDAGCPVGFSCQTHDEVLECRLEQPLEPVAK